MVYRGLYLKNIEGESTEANDLRDILYKWVCCVYHSNFTNVFTKQINEELKYTEFDGALYFFAKRRKYVEKMIHQKKNRGHRTSKIVKSRKSYGNGHLAWCTLRCDVVFEFARAIRMRRNN